MREAEQVLSLVGDIYDAALDPMLWTDMLPVIGELVGGQAGGLVSKDSVGKAGRQSYRGGGDNKFTDRWTNFS
jgi:hypothetical protein